MSCVSFLNRAPFSLHVSIFAAFIAFLQIYSILWFSDMAPNFPLRSQALSLYVFEVEERVNELMNA